MTDCRALPRQRELAYESNPDIRITAARDRLLGERSTARGIMRDYCFKLRLWLFLAALGMCGSCPALGLAQDNSANDIHRIDFRNFVYRPTCLQWEDPDKAETIRVKNGSFKHEGKNDDYVSFDVTNVVYRDLNGDGLDEAVVLTNCNTGVTGQFDEGFLYSMRNGKPVMLLRIHVGDRASGGSRSLKIENGLLTFEP